mmetsp:Transcript_46110/g.53904  ORF Transcript_46110/g.53904 Transcript_46110/m.53904 type:complete len:102 (-) Transcript_46110:122-427(-)
MNSKQVSVLSAVPLLILCFTMHTALAQTARPSTSVLTYKPTNVPIHKPLFNPTNIPTVGNAFDQVVSDLQYYLSGDFEFDISSSSTGASNKPITNVTELTA